MDVLEITRADATLLSNTFNLEAHNPATFAEFWVSVTGAFPSPSGHSICLPLAGPCGLAKFFFQPMPLLAPSTRRSIQT